MSEQKYNLSIEKIMELLDYYKEPEFRLLFRTLYYTGGRVSEALGLRPRDIFIESRVLMLPALKDKKRRSKGERKRVVIDGETLKLMTDFIKARNIKKDDNIFFSDIFNYDTRRWRAWVLVKKAGEGIGEPWIHPHTLRHSFATHWAAGGGDLAKLQRQLGHKRLQTTTDMYVRFQTSDIQKDYDKIFNTENNDAE